MKGERKLVCLALSMTNCKEEIRTCHCGRLTHSTCTAWGERDGNPSSTLAWRAPRTEEPGGCGPRRHRVGRDWAVPAWHTAWHMTYTAPTAQGVFPEQSVAAEHPGEAERRQPVRHKEQSGGSHSEREFGVRHLSFFKFYFPVTIGVLSVCQRLIYWVIVTEPKGNESYFQGREGAKRCH